MAFIIHNSSQTVRKPLVDKVVKLTGAKLFEAIMLENRNNGCTQSHIAVYKLVKPDQPVIVFEDDCEIIDESFMKLVKQHSSTHDLIFFGTNRTYFEHKKVQIWGTHAMWISPHAKKCFLNHTPIRIEIDRIWNEVIVKHNLKVWVPPKHDMYVRQKLGLISLITGHPRQDVSNIVKPLKKDDPTKKQ
jgi:GR25 family glycosyltransferase involved in LPS biosynthesis